LKGDFMEIWRDVEGYDGKYQVSNLGNVRSVDRTFSNSCGVMVTRKGIMLNPIQNRCGYMKVTMHKEGKVNTEVIHRLVAVAFVPNPNNLPQVNHKDGNKRNNDVSNLEWCTALSNMHHAKQQGLRNNALEYAKSMRKSVIATNIETGEEIFYESIHAAENVFGRHVTNVLSGARSKAKGHTFRYAEEVMSDAYTDYTTA
jgi:hypothetical protein